MNPETAVLVLKISLYGGIFVLALMLFLSVRGTVKEIKKKKKSEKE